MEVYVKTPTGPSRPPLSLGYMFRCGVTLPSTSAIGSLGLWGCKIATHMRRRGVDVVQCVYSVSFEVSVKHLGLSPARLLFVGDTHDITPSWTMSADTLGLLELPIIEGESKTALPVIYIPSGIHLLIPCIFTPHVQRDDTAESPSQHLERNSHARCICSARLCYQRTPAKTRGIYSSGVGATKI